MVYGSVNSILKKNMDASATKGEWGRGEESVMSCIKKILRAVNKSKTNCRFQ